MKTPRFLEYIEADGRQYIDTGVQVSSYTALYMRAKITEPSTNWDTLFGTRDGNTRRFTARFGNAENGELQIQFSTNRNYTTGYNYWNTGARKNVCNEDWMTVEMDSHAVFMGSTVEVTGYHYVHYKSTDGYKSWTQKSDTGGFGPYPASLYLFALHDKAEGAMDFAHMRLSFCEISGSGLNRAFYPALDENGRACLYDAVSDSYFYSKGEADFIAGPEINRMLLRVLTRSEGEEPSFSLTRVESVNLPVAKYYAPAYTVQDTDIKEFVGYDTDEAAFTPVFPTEEEDATGVPLDVSRAGQVLNVYAVWKWIVGYLIRDGSGDFYSKSWDGSRRNLGQLELVAQSFRDYAFQGYPGSEMLTDLSSPSIYNWTKRYWTDDEHVRHYYAPAAFEATLKGTPPLPQLVTYPTVTLRKRLAYITIPADPETTLWNVSFDGGATWYKYEDGWIAVTEAGDGCVKRRLEILDSDDWAPMLTNNTLTIRAWMWKNAWVSAIRVEYLEGD